MRIVAYVYPGWHPTAERDASFHPGFTEWELVRGCTPRFAGHHQPRVPALGEYDDRDPIEVGRRIGLALHHGVDAFVYCFYWCRGKRVFEDALDQGFLGSSESDLPFAVMWANRMPRRVLPVRRADLPVIDETRRVTSDVEDFVELVRMDLLAQKLQRLFAESLTVSDQEAREALLHRQEEVSLAFVALDTAAETDASEVADADVEALLADAEARVRERYEARSNVYQQAEAVRLRHILFQVAKDAPEEEVEAARGRAEATRPASRDAQAAAARDRGRGAAACCSTRGRTARRARRRRASLRRRSRASGTPSPARLALPRLYLDRTWA